MSISEHKHMPEPVRRIEVFTGAGRRRSWSGGEKAAIIAESYGAGETVCAVARRHGLTLQQQFTWRRLARRIRMRCTVSGAMPPRPSGSIRKRPFQVERTTAVLRLPP